MQENFNQVNNYNAQQQIEALQQAHKIATQLVPYRLKLNEVNKEIKFMNKKINIIRNGLPKYMPIVVGVLLFLIVEFIINPIISVILTAVYFCWYSTFFSKDNLPKREELAQKVLSKDGPKLLQEQNDLNTQIQTILNSDEGFNASMLVPEEFFTPEKIQALINIINTRSANDISGAIEVYNRTK